MAISERVMGLGDWSIRLRDNTPPAVLESISTPFAQIVVTPTRVPAVDSVTDALILGLAKFCGVILRPGPQREIGGASLAWYLGDEDGGPGVFETSTAWASSTSVTAAVGTVVSGTAFTSGTHGAATLQYANYQFVTRRQVLDNIAREAGYEWRISASRVVTVNTPAAIYGSTPTALVVRRMGGREAASPQGVTGDVQSSWDWEKYGSKAYVFSKHGYGSSGGASTYRDPAGNLMTVVRVFEETDAPASSESTIAAWWLSQINRTVRTVSVSSTDYAVTETVPVGSYLYLYDHELGLYDFANQVQYQGRVIFPVIARVVAITWPVEKGMGVYHRAHNGTSATYTDLSDYVEWESPGAQFEVSTAAQSLAPPSQAPPLVSFFSPWAKYAAEWRAVTTNPVIGNGTIDVSFRRLGTQLEINGKITPGSSTSFGSGEWRVTLPPGCTATTTRGQQLGNLLLIPSGGGAAVPGNIWVDQAATEMRLIYWPTSTTTGSVTGAAPFAWVASSANYLTFDIAMEIQP